MNSQSDGGAIIADRAIDSGESSLSFATRFASFASPSESVFIHALGPVGDFSRLALARRIRQVFASEAVEDWQRCFVLVTDIKVRVHRSD